MADLWERVKRTATEIYSTASERAVDGVHIGVKKLDEVNIRRELSREFAGLGGRAYQLLRRGMADDLPNDATIRHHLSRLEELEERLEEKEREIRDIRDGREEETAPVVAELPLGAPEEPSAPEEDPPTGDS